MTADGQKPAEVVDLSTAATDETIEIDLAEVTSDTTVVLEDLLDEIYAGQERVTQAEIHRRAVATEAPADVLIRITAMPEGEYAIDEAAELLGARGMK